MHVLFVMTLVIICLLASGCSGKSDGIAADKYILIEEVRQESPTVLAGQLPVLNLHVNTNSTYDGQPEKYVTVNDSLAIIYVRYNSLTGPNREFVSASGIYGFPATLDPGLTLLGVDGDGAVYARFGNESFCIRPAKSWRSPDFASRIENGTGVSGPYSVCYYTHSWIYNQGFRDKMPS